jgi:23S rRNA (adenine2503-C2)-methyltransferase
MPGSIRYLDQLALLGPDANGVNLDPFILSLLGRKHRITFEVVLIAGRTDRELDVAALKRFIPPLSVMVNLIPWNPAAELDFQEPSPERIAWYREALERAGIPVTERMRKGRGVCGACGQLAVLEDRADAAYSP